MSASDPERTGAGLTPVFSRVSRMLGVGLVAGPREKRCMDTHRKPLSAFPANWFAGFLCLLAGCLAAPSQARSQSNGERSDVYLINDGDSLLNVNGSPGTKKTSLSFALPLLNGSMRAVNTSIPGETLAQMVDSFSKNVGSKYESKYRVFIVHGLGGGNDIRAGASAAQVYALLQAYVRSVHALGPNAVAIVSTYPLQCDIFRAQPRRAAVQTYNDLIYDG